MNDSEGGRPGPLNAAAFTNVPFITRRAFSRRGHFDTSVTPRWLICTTGPLTMDPSIVCDDEAKPP